MLSTTTTISKTDFVDGCRITLTIHQRTVAFVGMVSDAFADIAGLAVKEDEWIVFRDWLKYLTDADNFRSSIRRRI